jgi:hypothetical protein
MENFFYESIYDIYLKTSQIPDSGLGVYTRDFIPKGKNIDEYVGDNITVLNNCSDYTFTINEKFHIDAANYPRCYMAMLNDASHISKKYEKNSKKKNSDTIPNFYYDNTGKILINNCYFIVSNNRVFVCASRNIDPEEELFVYYGDEYWRGRK